MGFNSGFKGLNVNRSYCSWKSGTWSVCIV